MNSLLVLLKIIKLTLQFVQYFDEWKVWMFLDYRNYTCVAETEKSVGEFHVNGLKFYRNG